MELTKNILELLNNQVEMELIAHFKYRSMANWFHKIGLFGFEKWMEGHAREEYQHAEKIISFLKERHSSVSYKLNFDFSQDDWEDVEAVIVTALEHEYNVTRSIYNIRENASSEGDAATEVFMDWFVEEQVEEEDIV